MGIFAFLFQQTVRFWAIAAVGVPLFILLIGYTRDVVRIFNAQQIQKALELSYYSSSLSGKESYPETLDTLIQQKYFSVLPVDPIHAVDLNSINVLMAGIGIPDSVIDPSVTHERGYQFLYRRESKSTYEVSTKLESVFMYHRMMQDGGNDAVRYELGNDVTNINTSFACSGCREGISEAQRKSLEAIQKAVQ